MIYRAELPRLIRFLAFHGASPADAADAAQDALIKVYQRLDRVRTMKAPGAYLRKIALNEWKRLRDVPVADRDHVSKAGWIDLGAADDVYGKDDIQVVLDSLAALPGQQRQVMAWLYDGYTAKEIAAQLDMKANTVRSNIRHAKAKLQEFLAPDGEEG